MRYTLLLLLSLAFSFPSEAQMFTVKDSTSYSFWVHQPDSSTERKPLILFLHGKSLSGTDLNRVKRYGPLKAIEKGLEIPAFIAAPQLPHGPWNADKVNEVVDYMVRHYAIDTNRIYITGMSLGSYGTMKYVGQFAHRVAAAVSICGGGDVKDACAIAQVPVQVIHGDKDFIVPLSESRKIVNAVKKCLNKAPIELKVIKGGNHGSVENIYRSKAIYDWLFQYKKEIPNS